MLRAVRVRRRPSLLLSCVDTLSGRTSALEPFEPGSSRLRSQCIVKQHPRRTTARSALPVCSACHGHGGHSRPAHPGSDSQRPASIGTRSGTKTTTVTRRALAQERLPAEARRSRCKGPKVTTPRGSSRCRSIICSSSSSWEAQGESSPGFGPP